MSHPCQNRRPRRLHSYATRLLGLGRDSSIHLWRQTFVGELLEDNYKYRLNTLQALQRDAMQFRTTDFMSITNEDFDDVAYMASKLQSQANEVRRTPSAPQRSLSDCAFEATLCLSSLDTGEHISGAGSPRSRSILRFGFPLRVGRKRGFSPPTLLGDQPPPSNPCAT